MNATFAELAQLGLLLPYLKTRLVSGQIENVQLSDEEVIQARAMFAREHQIQSEADLEAFAAARLVRVADLDAQVLRPLRVMKLCRDQFSAKAEARFLERKSQLDVVVYSLLRLRDAGLARELYLQIAAGESGFADLAAAHAEGPEKQTHGIIGPVPMSQAHPVLADRLRTADTGVVLEPFQVLDWWLIVRLEQYTPATFDQATADAMSRELFEQWVDEQLELTLAELRPSLVSSP